MLNKWQWPLKTKVTFMAIKASAKILLLHPNGQNRKQLKGLITKLGLKNILETSKGDETVDLVKEHLNEEKKAELVLIEWDIDLINAVDISKRIRELDKALPIILMATEYEKADIAQLAPLGKISILQKPFSQQQLLGKMAEAFGQKKKK